MEIIVAETAGFCFGVSNAVKLTNEKLNDGKVYTYGPIIHNKHVVQDFEKRGAKVLNDIDDYEINLENETVVIRSHGVSKEIYNKLKEKKANIVDATCPFVSKIHKIVEKDSKENRRIIIVGNPNHFEVIGIKGWAGGDSIVISEIEDVDNINFDKDDNITIVSQTTFNKNKFEQIVEKILKKGYHINVYDTICNATKNRQSEANDISKFVDAMLVVGDKQSSNTLKLFEICVKNCPNTHLVETFRDIDKSWIEDSKKVGITAGASTPKYIIEEVLGYVRRKL